MTFPFRFYGAAPSDWYEGANAGHTLTICFVRPLGHKALQALGAAWARVTAASRVDPSSAAISGAFLRLVYGESSRGQGGDHLQVQEDFVRDAHRIVPVQDAVYDNARDGSDAWTLWSHEQGPPATRPDDFAPSPAFDRGASAVDHGAASIDADPEPTTPAAAATATSPVTPTAELRERLSTAPTALQRQYKGSHVAETEGCHLVAKKKGQDRTILIHVRGTKRKSLTKAVKPHLVKTILGVALTPSGDRGFVRTHGRLIEVTAKGEARIIATSVPGRPVFDIAAPNEDCVLWVDAAELHRLDRVDGVWTETARLPAEEVRYILNATAQECVLLAYDPIHPKRRFPLPTRRVSLGSGGLELVGNYDVVSMRATWEDGGWIVCDERKRFHRLG